MAFCFKKAERLLKESNLSVSEIALQLKFTNRTHFYNLFRKNPQEWRRHQAESSAK